MWERCKRPGCRLPPAVHGLCLSDYRAALRRSHRGNAPEPTQSDWGLASDGIFDDVAVGVAARGERYVRLTPTEQLGAAFRIIRAGGDAQDLQTRLGVNHNAALALIRALAG
jgi:hypothetical protein